MFGIYRATPRSYAPAVRTPVHFSVRLPRPLWIFLASVAIAVVSLGLRFGEPIWRRQLAIWELERIGGRLSFDKTGPSWLRELVGDRRMRAFDAVDWINFRSTPFYDWHVTYMNAFPALRGIELDGTQITDSGVARLENFRKLEHLSLSDTPITDNGLEDIARFRTLKTLRLDHTRLGDEGLRRISQLSNLKGLNVEGTKITDDGLAQLSRLTQLRQLTICGTHVTDAGLKNLTNCTELRHLIVFETTITEDGALELEKVLPRLGVIGTNQYRPGNRTASELRTLHRDFRKAAR